MQNGHQVEALDDFATAVREDPENSDVYHHRGQVAFRVYYTGTRLQRIRLLRTSGHNEQLLPSATVVVER